MANTYAIWVWANKANAEAGHDAAVYIAASTFYWPRLRAACILLCGRRKVDVCCAGTRSPSVSFCVPVEITTRYTGRSLTFISASLGMEADHKRRPRISVVEELTPKCAWKACFAAIEKSQRHGLFNTGWVRCVSFA